jgi:hypothetical protein
VTLIAGNEASASPESVARLSRILGGARTKQQHAHPSPYGDQDQPNQESCPRMQPVRKVRRVVLREWGVADPRRPDFTYCGYPAAEVVEPSAQADDDNDSLSCVEDTKGHHMILADPILAAPYQPEMCLSQKEACPAAWAPKTY